MADPAGTPQPHPIQPPYPTHAELHHMLPSAAGGKLLFWPLDGPTLETSGLAVMAGPTNPDVRAPYYDAATGAWHPVSQLPISEPRASSITVHVTELADWEVNWEETHFGHIPEFADEEGYDGDDDGGVDRVECCGTERPVGRDVSIVVTGTGGAAAGGSGGFVTVHDFVAAVHPWLMGLRSNILGALATLNGEDAPLRAETELMVDVHTLANLMINNRAEWIRCTKKEPVAVPPELRELLARNRVPHPGLR